MKKINVAVIGTGWCGGIRAIACAASPWINELHIAEIKEDRLKEIAELTKPVTATTDYRVLLEDESIEAVMISTTPEPTHYPIAKESLLAGKHVFLKKPIALELREADELIALAKEKKLFFTIGYSQRFNPKFAYVKRSIEDGTIGQPVSALVSRHITRNLGKKIGGRVKLSPAAMEATHDIDFVLWCLAPRRPVRVYAQEVKKIMGAEYNVPDCVWIVVTMDDGSAFTIGAGWVLPPLIRIFPPPGSNLSVPKARSWSTIHIAMSTSQRCAMAFNFPSPQCPARRSTTSMRARWRARPSTSSSASRSANNLS